MLLTILQERLQIEHGTLTIPSVNLSDTGMYQCVAENRYGVIYVSAELSVIGELLLLKSYWKVSIALTCFIVSNEIIN